jgi:protein-tyrosine phosphatase
LFNHEARRRGLAWRADSAGLDPDPANPGSISRHTCSALQRLGIECPTIERLPRTAALADFLTADLVVAVKRAEHEPLISANFPQRLAVVEFWDVHDLDCASPEEAILCLRTLVLELLDRLSKSSA